MNQDAWDDQMCEMFVKVAQQPRMHTNTSGDKHRADFYAFLQLIKENHIELRYEEGWER